MEIIKIGSIKLKIGFNRWQKYRAAKERGRRVEPDKGVPKIIYRVDVILHATIASGNIQNS